MKCEICEKDLTSREFLALASLSFLYSIMVYFGNKGNHIDAIIIIFFISGIFYLSISILSGRIEKEELEKMKKK